MRVEEIEQRQTKQRNNSKKVSTNFEQRNYPKEFFDSLYENIPYKSSTETEKVDEMDLDM